MKSIGKTALLAAVFVGSLMALVEIKGGTPSGNKIHRMIFIETVDDWRKCTLQNCRIINDVGSVMFAPSSSPSMLTTEVIDPGFSFTQLILSWNATMLDTISVLHFSVDVSPDSEKWQTFDYQAWGAQIDGDTSERGSKNIQGLGRIVTDFLVLEKPMHYARVSLAAVGLPGAHGVNLRRLSLSFSSNESDWKTYNKIHSALARPEYGKVKLAVPYFTQRSLPSNLSGNCCSPTSVSMVLNYYGRSVTPEEFAYLVYDPRGEIYGNWPYNAAAAYIVGMGRTWVETHCSFDEIYDEVAAGRPVVISIAYGYDELPHSPIHEALEGHLITVVGFDGPDVVICNDPAGHNVEDGIVNYPRRELEIIWQKHGGVAYHIWPD